MHVCVNDRAVFGANLHQPEPHNRSIYRIANRRGLCCHTPTCVGVNATYVHTRTRTRTSTGISPRPSVVPGQVRTILWALTMPSGITGFIAGILCSSEGNLATAGCAADGAKSPSALRWSAETSLRGCLTQHWTVAYVCCLKSCSPSIPHPCMCTHTYIVGLCCLFACVN